MARTSWLLQLVGIYEKGMEANRAGMPREACPYQGGYNGGGNVQRQRREYWQQGWDEAARRRPKP